MLPSTDLKASAPRTIAFSVLNSPAHPYRCRRFACPLAGANARLAEKRGLVTPSFRGTCTPNLLPVRLAHQTIGAPATFRRGISAPPALGNEVYATSHDDVGLVYARPAKTTVEIGTIHQEKSLPAYAILDDLLGKHFAILGTTGSGKSCATALILHGIIEQHDNAHVVLLDPHGEYAQAFGEKAETIEPNDLQIPHWLFNFEEFVEIVFADESKELVTETTVLRNLIQTCKASFIGDGEDAHSVTVDTPVPYKMGDLTRIIDDTMGRLENRNDLVLLRHKRPF